MGINTTICLYYSRNTYTLTLNKGDYISSVTGGGTYKVGQSVTINATVANSAAGYTNRWDKWESNNTSLLTNPTTQNATITMPAGDIALKANGARSVNTYTITLNNQSATTAGTTAIYEKYATGIYLNSGCTTAMTTTTNPITKPTKSGYTFGGYYTATNGGGTQIINQNGYITANITNTSYTAGVTLYAKWVTLPGIYVTLYTDGTLGFCSTTQKIAGKTVQVDYGNIDGKVFDTKSYSPWYKDGNYNNIKSAIIVDEIAPLNTAYWFYGLCYLTQIENMQNLDTSKVTDMRNMFYNCRSLISLDVSKFRTSNVTNMTAIFHWCQSLTSLDLRNFNTSNVTDMHFMFYECQSLTNLDLRSFNTSKVIDMQWMFADCYSLTSLDVSKFDTSKVTNMEGMFLGCRSLRSLNLSNFNTSNVTVMFEMFTDCESLTSLDLRSFNTSKVTNMDAMFQNCSSLTSLDVSKFNTSNVTNMSAMFNGCRSLTSLNVRSFNTSKVTNMLVMFNNCSSLTSLDLRSFNTKKVTDMRWMFSRCSKLSLVTVGSEWVTSSNNGQMFEYCKISDVTRQ